MQKSPAFEESEHKSAAVRVKKISDLLKFLFFEKQTETN